MSAGLDENAGQGEAPARGVELPLLPLKETVVFPTR